MKLFQGSKKGCRYWLKLLVVGVTGGLTLACIAIEIEYIYVMTSPVQGSICCTTPATYGLAYENVSLKSSDGAKISGWYIPSKNRSAVILLHGYGGNRLGMMDHARMLAKHGYGVLFYDLRGHGESEGDLRAYGWPDTADVMAAIAYLKARAEVNPRSIGLLGCSIGGQIALRSAAENKEINGVIADDPSFVTIDDAPTPQSAQEWPTYAITWVDVNGIAMRTGLSVPPGIRNEIPKISPRPLLLIINGQGMGQNLGKHFYEMANEPKALWLLPEADHCAGPTARPTEYEEKITSFFNQALKPNSVSVN
jgi:pimeloyl-ACP methyl ester carboxylesterase